MLKAHHLLGTWGHRMPLSIGINICCWSGKSAVDDACVYVKHLEILDRVFYS
jgi:hypothetical protein